MYIHLKSRIMASSSAPAGCTITSDIKDLLAELDTKVEGSYALEIESLQGLREILEDGEHLATLGITDAHQEGVESLHSFVMECLMFSELDDKSFEDE